MNPEFKKELEKLKKETEEQAENIPKVLLKTSFDLLFELIDSNEILINIPDHKIVNHKAILSKNDTGGFTIDIENILSDMSETYNIELLIGENTYFVSDLFISMRGTKLTRNEHNKYFSGQIVFTGQIHELRNNVYNENELFNRFIIPSKSTQLDYYIKTEGYRDESSLNFQGRLSIEVDDCKFVLYEKKYRDQYYFILDSTDPIKSAKFSDICHSIMIAYGFLSADFIQNDAYYFTSNDSDFNSILDFSYLQLRSSIF